MKQKTTCLLSFLFMATTVHLIVAAPMAQNTCIENDEVTADTTTFENFSSKEGQDTTDEENMTDEEEPHSEHHYQIAALSAHQTETTITLSCAPLTSAKTDLLQDDPPTKHPIERKAVKVILGWSVGVTCLLIGVRVAVSVARLIGITSLLTLAGICFIFGVAAGLVGIYYTWQFINDFF